MAPLSKLSSECQKCPHINNCDNKRMAACAISEWKPCVVEPIAPITTPLVQPMTREEHQITINMGEYGKIDTSLEEITKKIERDFYRKAFDIDRL